MEAPVNKKLPRFLIAAVALVLSVPLVAHHGAASFDTGKELTLKGTVTDWTC